MTQAVNLANFANNLDSSGGVAPSALNAQVPISKGGTNATTVSDARTNLGLVIGTDIPSPTGTGASGTWGISISGNAATATNATNATNATYATTAGNGGVTSVNGSTGAVTVNSVGVGQTWQDVTSSRTSGTTYTNSTGKPIMVNVYNNAPDATYSIAAYVGGLLVGYSQGSAGGDSRRAGTVSFIVPTGTTYVVSYSVYGFSAIKWVELR